MLRKFIEFNRSVSLALCKRYNNFYYGLSTTYREDLKEKVVHACKVNNARKILDAGSIDRPLIPLDSSYVLTGLDIEYSDKCETLYDNFVVQSIEEPLQEKYDLIFSITLLEHVSNNAATFEAIYNGLESGGETIHYVPCKNHPYALILRLISNRIQKYLIKTFRPWVDQEVSGYQVFFSYCSPGEMKRLLEKIGFCDIEIKTYYRANDYFSFFTPLYIAVSAFENLCKAWNWEFFASAVIVSARKPESPMSDPA